MTSSWFFLSTLTYKVVRCCQHRALYTYWAGGRRGMSSCIILNSVTRLGWVLSFTLQLEGSLFWSKYLASNILFWGPDQSRVWWWEQFERNLICIRAKWNTVHEMNNKYTNYFMSTFDCLFFNISYTLKKLLIVILNIYKRNEFSM